MPRWHSKSGIQTTDNRDYYGIAEVHDTRLFIVIDGATSSPNGGALARVLVQQLLDEVDTLETAPTRENLIDILTRIHTALRHHHPGDSASYIIAYQLNNHTITTLHAGDCRLGKISPQNSIQWLTKPHTLANAISDLADHDLINDPKRHLLTRSFKGQRFQAPECNTFGLSNEDTLLLLASDGFWAGLSQESQLNMLNGASIDSTLIIDDTSCLQWSLSAQPFNNQQAERL